MRLVSASGGWLLLSRFLAHPLSFVIVMRLPLRTNKAYLTKQRKR